MYQNLHVDFLSTIDNSSCKIRRKMLNLIHEFNLMHLGPRPKENGEYEIFSPFMPSK